jgi:hypothetical protein
MAGERLLSWALQMTLFLTPFNYQAPLSKCFPPSLKPEDGDTTVSKTSRLFTLFYLFIFVFLNTGRRTKT